MAGLARAASLTSLRLLHGLLPRLRRVWRFRGLTLYIPPGVFNPVVAVSSGLLADLVSRYAEGVVVDIGCGSGALTLVAASTGRVELAVGIDVNPLALAAGRVNARLNGLEDRVACLPPGSWQPRERPGLVIVNPPYLPCPQAARDTAWCGGLGLEAATSMLLAAARMRPRLIAVSFSTLSGTAVPRLLAGLRARVVDARAVKLGPETVYAAVLHLEP